MSEENQRLSKLLANAIDKIISLKAQLAQSVRVHPMSELPEIDVIGFTERNIGFKLRYVKSLSVWEYMDAHGKTRQLNITEGFIGWIDPREVKVKEEQ